MRKIRVLIVDDAVVVRQLLTKILQEDAAIEVVGSAPNGRIGVAKVEQLRPDLVILDVDMPEMDGLEALTVIRRRDAHLPILMFSTLTQRGAATTLEALALGATDYVTKPANVGSVSESMQRVREELLPRIKALCSASAPALSGPPTPQRPAAVPLVKRRPEIVVIGCSTGGPNALADLLPALPGDFPLPVLVVQHMPPIFTKLLADRLSAKSALKVMEAAQGDLVQAGVALLAPGNFHMAVFRDGTKIRVRLHQGPTENSCRPAADVLFRSVAEIYGARTFALVLTGMGQDGLRGCEQIRTSGGQILVQDEASSVVWGMPGSVATAGLADRVLPLGQIAVELVRAVWESRPWRRSAPPYLTSTGGPST